MSTVRQEELASVIERRRALGQDGHDEMWEGVYWLAPHAHSDHGIIQEELATALRPWGKRAGLLASGPFNLGEPTDYRVPDGGYFRTRPGVLYVPTAVVVIEVLSPGDETFRKLDFYAAHGVLELLVAFPDECAVRCYDLTDQLEIPVSRVLGVDLAALGAEMEWPGQS